MPIFRPGCSAHGRPLHLPGVTCIKVSADPVAYSATACPHRVAAMSIKLGFYGAAGTVTGSKYLVQAERARLLVDCGLFQGFKTLRLRNWAKPDFNSADIAAVVLTHAHLDHSGYLPVLIRQGFAGPILCTPATRDLCEVLLSDSGHLQEREAEFANRRGYSKHKPAQPLYTQQEAEAALKQFRTVEFGRDHVLGETCRVRFDPAGHILGAAIVSLAVAGRKLVFSGDLGRAGSATMPDPTTVSEADYLVVESTYGNRRHPQLDPEEELAERLNPILRSGGTVLIPAFAVGRTQTLLYHLYKLKQGQRIPDVPVYLDSPMAINASNLFIRHADANRLTAAESGAACAVARYTRSVEESKQLDIDTAPKIIISASGMATGGRVLHHLRRYAPGAGNLILFSGFQAGGTRGAALVEGAESIKLLGDYVPVRAAVSNLDMLSAHADADGIMAWLKGFSRSPSRCFVCHGEPAAADALRRRIADELHWPVSAPEHRDVVSLDD